VKIPGVRKAKVDVARHLFSAEIELGGLHGAIAVAASKNRDAGRALSSTDFIVDEILDALEAAKVALETAPETAGAKR